MSSLLSSFAKVSLGFFPTPLHPLTTLSKLLGGPEIYIKRDDHTGLALGGNKTRKLEYILGDVAAKNCDTVITAGATQSNHCRQTVAAAATLGLDCHLVLGGSQPENTQGNLLLDHLLGCTIHWAGENRKGEDIPALFDELKQKGKKPYIVPYGGSNQLGALGYIHGMEELSSQIDKDAFSHFIFASSSGGTHAGMILGRELTKMTGKVVGINIDKDEEADLPFSHRITVLVEETAKILNHPTAFREEELLLNNDYLGDGYGVAGNLEKEAISLMARHEGILLDPVYTGRAMGGLIDMIRNNKFDKDEKILFWHTGGAPALFAYPGCL